jgi:hypothetical protein
MKINKDGFFGTDNIYRAVWSVAGGAVVYFFTKGMGPQRVIIDESSINPITALPTTQVQTQGLPSKEDLNSLTNAVTALSKTNNNSGNDEKTVRELMSEVAKLREQVAKANTENQKKSSEQTLPQTPLTSRRTSNDNGKKNSPAFNYVLPTVVKGYGRREIIGSSAELCPYGASGTGSAFSVSFNVEDLTLLERATPLRATLAMVESPLRQVRVAEKWAPLSAGANTISLTPKQLDAGEYELTYGFYLKSELNSEYPNFYSKTCRIKVI